MLMLSPVLLMPPLVVRLLMNLFVEPCVRSSLLEGTVGVPLRSLYDPLVATVARLGVPLKSVYAPEVATVAREELFTLPFSTVDSVEPPVKLVAEPESLKVWLK